MAKLSEVQIESLLFGETAAAGVATPDADTRRLFLDTDGVLKWKDEAGTVTEIGAVPDASDVPFTPAGSIAATDVQAAIEEVASEAAGGSGLWDAGGWAEADALTYATATTVTLSGDHRVKYQRGTRIKVTQSTGGTKYFVVTNVAYSDPTTTITLFGGSDYTLANEAISDPFYSYMLLPQGQPGSFANTQAWNADSVNPAIVNGTLTSRVAIDGRYVTWSVRMTMGSSTTYGSGVWRFPVPISAAGDGVLGLANYWDTSPGAAGVGVVNENGASTALTTTAGAFYAATTPITWASGDFLAFHHRYRY